MPTVTLCVAAPASDQETNPYWVPPTVCRVGAESEMTEPSMNVAWTGPAPVVPPPPTVSPVGFDWKVRTCVLGYR